MTEAEKENITNLLYELISAAVPKAATVQKYGGTLFTLRPDEKEGQFCGIFPCKAHVHLSFANGYQLDDPNGLLEGGGKYRRHLNFHSLDDVDAKIVRQFVKKASKL